MQNLITFALYYLGSFAECLTFIIDSNLIFAIVDFVVQIKAFSKGLPRKVSSFKLLSVYEELQLKQQQQQLCP